MSFSHALWLLPLVALPGLWLAWRLYAAAPLPGARARLLLLFLTGAAWLLLSWLIVAPMLRSEADVYHPPVVVLAVDAGRGFDALGAGAQARIVFEDAHRHYEARGFTVLRLAFAERIVASGEDDEEDAGPLARPLALLRHLDSLAAPNLQAIFIATDARFHGGAVPPGAWPAPVFPVHVVPETGEVQGESVSLHLQPGSREVGSDVEVEVRWRMVGESGNFGGAPGAAMLELRDSAGTRLAGVTLSVPEGIFPGSLVTSRVGLPLPSGVFDADARGNWFALLRPAVGDANLLVANDTVPVIRTGLGRARHVFAGPVATLRERGLIDALSATDSFEVSVMRARESAIPENVTAGWARAGAPHIAMMGDATAGAGIPLLAYGFGDPEGAMFGADARVFHGDNGAEFLPPSILRLGDLAADTLRLPPFSSGREPLAWVEHEGRKGLLFWRDSSGVNRGEHGNFGIIVPPLWEAAFRPDGGRRVAEGRAWMRGVARWAVASGTADVSFPDTAFAGRPFSATARLPDLSRADAVTGEIILEDVARGVAFPVRQAASGMLRIDSLVFPAGRHTLRLVRDGEVVWSGVLRVRDPEAVALVRIGADIEALQALAAASGVALLRVDTQAARADWPALPGGQVREARDRVIEMAPLIPFILIVTVLFSISWWLRKRHRLD